MSWRYQATHRTVETPAGSEDVFEVREVYEGMNADDSPAWTEAAIAPDSDTKDGLMVVLRKMLNDVHEFDVLEVGE